MQREIILITSLLLSGLACDGGYANDEGLFSSDGQLADTEAQLVSSGESKSIESCLALGSGNGKMYVPSTNPIPGDRPVYDEDINIVPLEELNRIMTPQNVATFAEDLLEEAKGKASSKLQASMEEIQESLDNLCPEGYEGQITWELPVVDNEYSNFWVEAMIDSGTADGIDSTRTCHIYTISLLTGANGPDRSYEECMRNWHKNNEKNSPYKDATILGYYLKGTAYASLSSKCDYQCKRVENVNSISSMSLD